MPNHRSTPDAHDRDLEPPDGHAGQPERAEPPPHADDPLLTEQQVLPVDPMTAARPARRRKPLNPVHAIVISPPGE